MATLLEQAKQMGIEPANKPKAKERNLLQVAREMGIQPANAPKQEPKEGILQRTAKAIATTFAKPAVQAINLGESVFDVARGDIQGANQALEKKRNVPFLGPTGPVVTGSESDFDIAKKTIGSGLEVGSNLLGAPAVKGVLQQGFRQLARQGVKRGAIQGATLGTTEETGRALREGEGIPEAVGQGLLGGAIGATTGGVLGGASAATGAAFRSIQPSIQKTRDFFSRPKDAFDEAIESATSQTNRPDKTMLDGAFKKAKDFKENNPIVGAIQERALGIKQKVKNRKEFAENIRLNTKEKEKARLQLDSYNPEKRAAVTRGLLSRDVDLIKEANPRETQLMQNLVKAADDFENVRTAKPPSEIFGQEVRTRLDALRTEIDQAGNRLEKAIEPFKGQPLPNAWRDILSEMNEVSGLRGINISQDGTLDFTRTALRGSGTQAERKRLQQAFNDAIKSNAEQAHRLRQELFEELGGRTRAGIKTTDTADRGTEAVRKGLAKSLGDLSSDYGEANARMAQLLDAKRGLAKYFGDAEKGKEDIFDAKAGTLLRRLTNNAQSGGDIRAVLREIEELLGQSGVAFDTDLVKLQEFINLLNRYYDIAGDTSLLGILRTSDVPTTKSDLLMSLINTVTGEGKATKETAKEALKGLLGQN